MFDDEFIQLARDVARAVDPVQVVAAATGHAVIAGPAVQRVLHDARTVALRDVVGREAESTGPSVVRGTEPRGPHAGRWLICQAIAGDTPTAFNAALRAALNDGHSKNK